MLIMKLVACWALRASFAANGLEPIDLHPLPVATCTLWKKGYGLKPMAL
jgi:hypothetical protein